MNRQVYSNNTKALKVLVVDVGWPPLTFLERLFYGLADEGVVVTLSSSQQPEKKWLDHPNCHWLFAPDWNTSRLRRFFAVPRLLKACLTAHKGMKHSLSLYMEGDWRTFLYRWYKYSPLLQDYWDVVYFPWNSTAIEYLPLFKYLGPTVVSCRGSQINIAPHEPERVGFVAGLKGTFEVAAAVHCVSEAIKKEAIQYGLDPAKAWVIRPAVDPDFFCPAAEKKIRPSLKIITVGTLIWTKGYEYALTALRLLHDQGLAAEFIIIGDGPDRSRVLYTIEDLDLRGQVYLLGKQPPTKVRELLQEADIFLLASLSEGISNAVLEAMACGLPVVTTDCGGMREAVTDGIEGFVVPVMDPEAMAGALIKLASSPDLREKMGQAARKKILNNFTLKEQIRAFVNLFETVKAGSRKRE